ncbi:hypothetical protein BT69DRAFT_1245129 [Atractiella rhizophila]|nr:hypothetical protein BT69DRAFT_1252644 [Atractiella rhizophila]KAH8919505.1 hypothetical protein BT69DRAFT_1266581 [Atractiella rhizophila]KAH8920594.1 hypothetical protein BT69DRAFT_1245129 [Atractiella rhizophila]
MEGAVTGNKTIYVGGLPPETNEEVLYNTFLTFGDVLEVQLPPDPTHNETHRGFGFVTFSLPISAHRAIDNMHLNTFTFVSGKQTIETRPLKVNLAKPTKGILTAGSNRPVWEDEEWLKEHVVGKDAEDGATATADGGDEMQIDKS